MELIQVGENSFYIENPTNIGVYRTHENEVYLIDTGNDRDAGKKILRLMDDRGWEVRGIIATHSHADHIGGNKLIQERTGCPVYAHGIEQGFTARPILEPSFIYGGYPYKELRNKFLLAQGSDVRPLEGHLPEGLEAFPLPGHYFDMLGIRTDDDVYFLADALMSELTITKYHVFFLYDVARYLETLDFLATLEGWCFIPSHAPATRDISDLVALNRQKIHEISAKICSLCREPRTFDELLKQIFDDYHLRMTPNQHVLISCTLRSYLSYLHDSGRLSFEFRDNLMYWVAP